MKPDCTCFGQGSGRSSYHRACHIDSGDPEVDTATFTPDTPSRQVSTQGQAQPRASEYELNHKKCSGPAKGGQKVPYFSMKHLCSGSAHASSSFCTLFQGGHEPTWHLVVRTSPSFSRGQFPSHQSYFLQDSLSFLQWGHGNCRKVLLTCPLLGFT
jgi:hypothetical protein